MSTRDLCIAIVEDNDTVRQSLETVLNLKGFNCDGFETAEVFLAANARANGFDGMIVDYRLPKMNGLQLISQLRDSGIETPAILMSGNFDADVRARADQLSAMEILRKPCHPKLLLETLIRLIPS